MESETDQTGSKVAPTDASGRIDATAGAPKWAAPLIRSTIWRIVWVALITALLIFAVLKMRSLVSMLVIALFFGIAMDPAVTHLHQKRGWSRGAATGTIFAGVVLFVLVTFFVLVPGLVHASSEIGKQIPTWITQLNTNFGIRVDGGKDPSEINADVQQWIQNWAHDHAPNLLGLASTSLGLVFQFFTIAMFTFYVAAFAPDLRRTILTQLPPERQQRLGWAMDNAIVQTGGYLYSRIVLMVINGGLFFVVMLLVGVDWTIALPLSIFQGFVSEFIPAVGTYIGIALPVIVTLGLAGVVSAAILLGWALVYQQIENYFLSPRLSAKTMNINGAVAFGSALAGGAIAGPMGAFMAMPTAALITAFIRQYARKYPLAYTSAYDDDVPVTKPDDAAGTTTPSTA